MALKHRLASIGVIAALSFAAPAMAQPGWHHGWHHHWHRACGWGWHHHHRMRVCR